MCRLIKYYESEYTIFLLIEYATYGKLYNYLYFLLENGDAFLNNLSKYRHYKKNKNSQDRPTKYSPKYHRKSFSQGSMSFKIDPKQFFKRTQSVREETTSEDPTNIHDLDQFYGNGVQGASTNILNVLSTNEEELKQKNSPNEKVVKISNLEKSSSNSSNEKDENDVKTKRWSFSVLKKLNSKINTKPQIVTFKNKENLDPPVETEIEFKNESDPYLAQIKLWLAQLICGLKALHKYGIVWKDLHSDNLLLSNTGNLLLTFTSKWSLVDENLNKEAVKNFYVAPELTGLVNYDSENEACDWWSFGIIAYEMTTMKVRFKIFIQLRFILRFKKNLFKEIFKFKYHLRNL
jgi:hypothetical protein